MDRAAVVSRVAARYRCSGRFAMHYVAGKLRHDPLTDALFELGSSEGFGTVADLGCGRGQFSALLLEGELASRVIGLETNAGLRTQAARAMDNLAFEAKAHDLTANQAIPQADTVLLFDVLYQLSTTVQAMLLDAVALSARRLILIRTADTRPGLRVWLTWFLEVLGRGIWPHSGAMVNPQPVNWIADRLAAAGWEVTSIQSQTAASFANVLLTARRPAH